MTMLTGVGLVRVMKQAQAGEAAEDVGSNDRQGLCKTFVQVDID